MFEDLSFACPKHIRFECSRCTLCCGDTEHRVRSILLLRAEAERISKKTLISISEFAEKNKVSELYSYTMKKTMYGKCLFLKDGLCSIYQIRPLICRFYPFQLQNLEGNRYVFTYTVECPGIGDGSYLKRKFFEDLFKQFTESMKEDILDIRQKKQNRLL